MLSTIRLSHSTASWYFLKFVSQVSSAKWTRYREISFDHLVSWCISKPSYWRWRRLEKEWKKSLSKFSTLWNTECGFCPPSKALGNSNLTLSLFSLRESEGKFKDYFYASYSIHQAPLPPRIKIEYPLWIMFAENSHLSPLVRAGRMNFLYAVRSRKMIFFYRDLASAQCDDAAILVAQNLYSWPVSGRNVHYI